MQLICNSRFEERVNLALQILVLLDVNPEESMLDEGLAREVINRIQKLRKRVWNLY